VFYGSGSHFSAKLEMEVEEMAKKKPKLKKDGTPRRPASAETLETLRKGRIKGSISTLKKEGYEIKPPKD
jgi:hypothetical protein